MRVPAGFNVEVYATGFARPRTMIYGLKGELLLADTDKQGSIYILFDRDNDFKAEDRKELITGLDRPYGLVFWRDYLYVGEPTSIKRYKYDANAMTVGPGEEVVKYEGMGSGHNTRALTFDPKGEKLYVGVGSASNVNAGEPKERAAVNRYNPDGTGYETYASGTRNPTDLHFYPGTNTLWAAVQERDLIGDDLVPDYFTPIQQGGFYGWPFAYFGPNEDPRRKGEAPDLVKQTIVPQVSLGAHTAVIEFAFYMGKQFPERYRGGAFLALHGSWNRSRRVGYSVGFVPFKAGRPTVSVAEDFLTGWMVSPDKSEVWGRPTGVLEMKDGSLLVSDDGGRKIWRISYKK
ncbi:MAG TPA: PQQ-dependent sugar dehydrogenase [Bryobacteraceae bacterium]|nr:PQQ-dependent sugar dehydrogenase [Bryobacteraceae bacterium]